MRIIDRVYIDGSFVEPHGEQWAPLFNPATEEQIGKVRLADEEDANRAVAAAKRAFPAFSNTSKEERITMLKRLHAAVSERAGDLVEAMRVEYAAPSRVSSTLQRGEPETCSSIWRKYWRATISGDASAVPTWRCVLRAWRWRSHHGIAIIASSAESCRQRSRRAAQWSSNLPR